MNWARFKKILLSLCMVCFTLGAVSVPAWAQEGSGTGEVRRLDPANKKITIKHGAISELDLPAMTLVYLIDPPLMQGLAPGDTVRFTARRSEGGEYIIIHIRKR